MNIDEIKFDSKGLLPTIVQDAASGEVLTLAFMNRESLKKCIETGETWFFSRSRQELWHKGETSGNTQSIKSMTLDCDKDTILVKVEPAGPACHTGERTCFYTSVAESTTTSASLPEIIAELNAVIRQRKKDMPEKSYTTKLFNKGIKKIAQKVGEEGVEVVIASLHETEERLTSEVGDLLYHLLVLLVAKEVSLQQVADELSKRTRISRKN